MNRPTIASLVLVVLLTCSPAFAQLVPEADLQGRLIERPGASPHLFEVALQIRATADAFDLGTTLLQFSFETDVVDFATHPQAGADYRFLGFDTPYNKHYAATVLRADKQSITVGIKLQNPDKGAAVPAATFKDLVILRFKLLSPKVRTIQWYQWTTCQVQDDSGQTLRKSCSGFDPTQSAHLALQAPAEVPLMREPAQARSAAIELGAAYPNPFNPQTRFALQVSETQPVHVALYDLSGRQVQTLYNGTLAAQTPHHFTIDGRALATGTYVYRAVGSHFIATRRVTLMK